YARGSLSQVARMFYQYGYFKPLAAWKVGQITTFRQLVPALFVAALVVIGVLAPWSGPARLALAGIAGAYLTAAVAGAALAPWRRSPPRPARPSASPSSISPGPADTCSSRSTTVAKARSRSPTCSQRADGKGTSSS